MTDPQGLLDRLERRLQITEGRPVCNEFKQHHYSANHCATCGWPDDFHLLRDCRDALKSGKRARVSVPTEPPREIFERLKAIQECEHNRAVHAHPMFSADHWEHNAGVDWPEKPDDDSYQAFENCVHPDCKAVRESLAAVVAPPPQEQK